MDYKISKVLDPFKVQRGAIPDGTNFVVIVPMSEKIYHEGDERSRTHPGHGYPAYTETREFSEMYACHSDTDLQSIVLALEEGKIEYTCLKASKLKISLQKTVRIDFGVM